MSALSALLENLLDYAGLFPPAKLPLADAMRNYAAYLRGPDVTRLGRFILPVARLPEFEAVLAGLAPADRQGWQLSVLAGPDAVADALALQAFNNRHPGARIVSLETKAVAPADVARQTNPFPAALEVWVEVPAAVDVTPFLAALKDAGRGAKIRTGGVTPEAFPAPDDVARFLVACRDTGIVAKATAGLHHPLRGDYRLTYEPGAPRGTMHGFLNVFLAAALVHAGGSAPEAATLLADTDPRNFSCAADALGWRDHRFTAARLTAVRRTLCRSFGSCSFTEPIEGLQKLRWL